MTQTTQPTPEKTPLILTVTGGSSSIKFAVVAAASAMKRFLGGQIERIGTPSMRGTATDPDDSTGKDPSANRQFKASGRISGDTKPCDYHPKCSAKISARRKPTTKELKRRQAFGISVREYRRLFSGSRIVAKSLIVDTHC